jgi:hypothetical protein
MPRQEQHMDIHVDMDTLTDEQQWGLWRATSRQELEAWLITHAHADKEKLRSLSRREFKDLVYQMHKAMFLAAVDGPLRTTVKLRKASLWH